MPESATATSHVRCRDPMLAHVREYLLRGWPENERTVELAPYRARKDELSVHDGCVLWEA